jgi:hypothetical protein
MAATVSRQIVGREAELRELVQLLDSATDGPAALLLEGDPGIGKTTVWKEALAEAGNRGFRVLSCGPAEVERDLAFAALGDLLEPALETMLPSLPAPQRRALDIALLRAEAGARGPDQRAVSVATNAAIRSLSVSSPVLLAIDDVQWLDPASARVLEFAIRRLEQEPICVLVTQRPNNEPGTPLALDRSLTERFDRLRLSPLGPEALDRLLRERLGAAFLRPTLLQLHRTSGGNPFFALELGRALLASEHSRGPAEPLPVPDNLKDPGREERARHLALGTEQPDETVAGELDEVARRALARGAPEAAAELAEHARRLTPAHATADLGRRAVEAADHHLQAGDTARAKALLEEVVAHTPDGELLASALPCTGSHASALARRVTRSRFSSWNAVSA